MIEKRTALNVFLCLTKLRDFDSIHTITHKCVEREKALQSLYQRAAGRCEAVRDAECELALEHSIESLGCIGFRVSRCERVSHRYHERTFVIYLTLMPLSGYVEAYQ